MSNPSMRAASNVHPMDLDSILSNPERATLVERIGDTPLLELDDLEGVSSEVTVFGKAEWFNPGGSVKDRPAWGMIRAGLESGALRPPRTLIDATSGNTGIAYAWIGAALGIPVALCVPANASIARKRMLAALGARLTFTDPMEGTDGAIAEARRIVAADPERWFYPDQYSNPENWRAHYRTTAEEIWAQTEGRVTHFVAGIGTSGTLVGVARRLRELNPSIEVVAIQPDSPYHALEGLKHLPNCSVPAIYDASVHARTIEVTSEKAIDEVKRRARRGLLLGWSAGAAIVAAFEVARALDRGVVVTILPDGASRYLDDPLWEEGA
jgi:cysteine synthase B